MAKLQYEAEKLIVEAEGSRGEDENLRRIWGDRLTPIILKPKRSSLKDSWRLRNPINELKSHVVRGIFWVLMKSLAIYGFKGVDLRPAPLNLSTKATDTKSQSLVCLKNY